MFVWGELPKYRKAILDYQREHFISNSEMAYRLKIKTLIWERLQESENEADFTIRSLRNFKKWADENIFYNEEYQKKKAEKEKKALNGMLYW